MSWAEIYKAVNDNLNKPLNKLIDEKSTALTTTVNNGVTNINNNTNTKASGITNLLGASNNTGGTNTAGSVFAKLNNCIDRLEAIRTYTVTNNAGSATGNLSQKGSQILSLLGATTDSGGTSSAGSVMSKLNGIYSNMIFSGYEVVQCDIKPVYKIYSRPAFIVEMHLQINDESAQSPTLSLNGFNFFPFPRIMSNNSELIRWLTHYAVLMPIHSISWNPASDKQTSASLWIIFA